MSVNQCLYRLLTHPSYPVDALSLYDDSFYDLVAEISGTAEVKLLEIQGIRSVFSFLNTEDVFEILTISRTALNIIKKSICFEADDKSFIVKPGCRSNIRYLYQLLHQKHEDHLKEISCKSKRNKRSMSQQNGNSVIDNTQDSNASTNTFSGFSVSLNHDLSVARHFKTDSFDQLKNWFETQDKSSYINIHMVQPLFASSPYSSSFLLAAYGLSNKFKAVDVLHRWLWIFEKFRESNVRVVAFSTDCDSRYLLPMRLATGFFCKI